MSYYNILVAVDFLGNDEHLIEAALNIASEVSEIKLIYVFEPQIYPGDAFASSVLTVAREESTEVFRQRLAGLVEKYSLTTEGHLICSGRPAAEIHAAAEKHDINLIVLGTHGRHGIQLLLGSTANAVLHGVKCDVLAVRVRS